MDFLTLVVALLMMQVNGSISFVQNDSWFRRWLTYSESFPMSGVFHLVLAVGLPCFVAGLLLWFASAWLGWLTVFLVQVVILAYALGRGFFLRYLHEYIDLWQTKDFDKLPTFLISCEQLMGAQHVSEVDDSTSLDMLRVCGNRLLLEGAFKRWFVVLFWFLLVNPIAALLYRLIAITRKHFAEKGDEYSVALLSRALFLMEWPMARLLGICFIVSGKVGEVFAYWCEAVLKVNTPNTDFLMDAATAALSIEPLDDEVNETIIQDRAISGAKEIKQLLTRCLILVAVVALFL